MENNTQFFKAGIDPHGFSAPTPIVPGRKWTVTYLEIKTGTVPVLNNKPTFHEKILAKLIKITGCEDLKDYYEADKRWAIFIFWFLMFGSLAALLSVLAAVYVSIDYFGRYPL